MEDSYWYKLVHAAIEAPLVVSIPQIRGYRRIHFRTQWCESNSVSGFWCYLALSIAICSGLQDLKHIQKKTVILKYAKKEKKKRKKRKKTKTAPNISHKHKSDSEVFPEQKEHSWGCCPKHHHHTVHSSQRGPMQPSCCQKPSELWEHIWLGSTWVPIKKGICGTPKKPNTYTGSTQSNPLTLKRNYSVIKTGPSYCISSRQASLAAQQGCDWSLPGSTQGQAGWGCEQPGL